MENVKARAFRDSILSSLPWKKMTTVYDASLTELSRRIAGRRMQLEEERTKTEARNKQLQALLGRIRSLPGAFDEEDCRRVEEQIEVQAAHLLDICRIVQLDEAKRKEREQLFRCMVGAINDRTRILEEDDECLKAHPDMLQYFARKQVSLQTLLKAKMEESMGSPVDHVLSA